jgi:hypothetical protein
VTEILQEWYTMHSVADDPTKLVGPLRKSRWVVRARTREGSEAIQVMMRHADSLFTSTLFDTNGRILFHVAANSRARCEKAVVEAGLLRSR